MFAAAVAVGVRPDPRLLFVVNLGVGDTTGADERAHVSTSERTVDTIGRLRAVDALSSAATVLVGGDAPESKAAAAKLEAQVVRLMASPAATWRMTGAHLLARWLDAFPEEPRSRRCRRRGRGWVRFSRRRIPRTRPRRRRNPTPR